MKVRFLVSMCGPSVTINPGDLRDVGEAEGQRYIERGYAVEVKEAPVREAAMISPPKGRK